jgi:hypothetical protein
VILTGVPRRCDVDDGPLTVSVDFQLSAPELAADPCRSATSSRLVIVGEGGVVVVVSLLPFDYHGNLPARAGLGFIASKERVGSRRR